MWAVLKSLMKIGRNPQLLEHNEKLLDYLVLKRMAPGDLEHMVHILKYQQDVEKSPKSLLHATVDAETSV